MKKANSFIFVEFAEAPRPVFKERRGQDQIVSYGEENNYPEYLLELFNNSSKHGAIVGGKAAFIAGKAIDGTSPLVAKANRYNEKLHNVIKKVALDVEIYGGFYLEVVANNQGTVAEVVHVPYHKVRLNKAMTQAWIKDTWGLGIDQKVKPRQIPVYGTTEGDSIPPRSLFMYKEYRPGLEVYSLPGYMAALNWIAADVEISRHVLQNAQAGFMPSKLVNMNDGEPVEDEKKEIEKSFNDKFTGHNGKKIIISFNNSAESAPTIQDLGASDMTKESFENIDNLVEQNVFSGHRITSPMLFGIKTSGQLGGRTEMRESWELLKNNYIDLKQNALVDALAPIVGDFDIVDMEPIGFESSDAVLTAAIQAAPKRWLLDKLGIKIEEYPEAFPPPPAPAPAPGLPGVPPVPGQVPQGVPPGSTPPGVPGQMASQADYTIFGKFGAPRGEYSIIKNKVVKFSSDLEAVEDELAMALDPGYRHLVFAITTLDGRILELIKEDPLMTISDLAKSLDVKPRLVQDAMDKLVKEGTVNTRMVKGQDGQPQVSYDVVTGVDIDENRPSNVEVGVRYSYEVKPEYREPNDDDPTGAIIEGSRDFCREMIKADRFYTRKDIEAMSAEMGYSVWDQKGGWMTERGTDIRNPECRHTWVSNFVVKKTK